ncbi:ROK family protein [Amycolatopsis jiangsuensis]|uniref:Putative NBD/HSP70 family sugar kinase n=1 Tax=Amycolatopsis jiangsuensis TaxID=1181879 RepID=A0A840J7D9_9PSEU|nr:ROK family protein [Amycolatopsis jiangsuensis]MBB4689629.1 putative NBD/HSP70 family sugar kinase [Amycolatopsis jiangsuensis]
MASPADTADVRRHNTSLVLRQVAEAGVSSRADIRRATGLVSGSVTSIVADLLSRGLLVEPGDLVSTRGRPQRVVGLNSRRVVGLVATVVPGAVELEVTDLSGQPRWSRRRTYDERAHGSSALLTTLAEGLDEAWDAAAADRNAYVLGTVLIVPGTVAADSVMTDSIDLGLRNIDFQAELAPLLRYPHCLSVFNDGRLGALAEYQALPPAVSPHVMAYVFSGPLGVGGGLVLDNQLFRGQHGLAGEVGHVVVDKDGPECACGARGCLTLYLGTVALAGRVFGMPPEPSAAGEASRLLVAKANAGDERTLAVLADAGDALASAVSTMSHLTDLGAVVLGGDLALFRDWLLEPVNALAVSRARVNPRFWPKVEAARFGDRSPQTGAWLTLRERVLANPRVVPPMTAYTPR